ncbi:hypothetical protein [Bacteriovorax sp. DB6_IX]|uniref:hypothetical protein n=1 Tax=Bacteriovorax sp. DB6_IX TaxID=1353530 RepID=UPI000556392B|nr:hypothetical protein [Bacteriovorax sp. DB6_IX]
MTWLDKGLENENLKPKNIESSLDNIWSKTVDIEAWPKWNPAMKKITIQSEGSVINNLSIEVGGIMGAILAPLLKGKLLQALVAENDNFKKYCES